MLIASLRTSRMLKENTTDTRWQNSTNVLAARGIAVRRLVCADVDGQRLLFAAVVTSDSSEVGPSGVGARE